MNSTLKLAFVVGTLALSSACTGARFSRVAPGMTGGKVAEVMHRGPSRVQPYSSTDAVWFYDEDRCVLFHNDQVVGKAQDVDEATVSTPIGAFVMTRRPGCAPAGYPNEDRLLPQIYTSQGNIRTR